jgi:hypothetical protein
MNFLKRLFSPRKAVSKSETPLFDMLLAASPAERRVQIKDHFTGMGNHEILAIYHGSYCMPVLEKINKFAKPKSSNIRVVGQPDVGGGWVYYVRGTFTQRDAKFLLKELNSCTRGKDSVRVTIPES